MRLIFLDTAGLIALWDESDQWHGGAMQAFELLKRGPFAAVTSPFILLECANAAVRRPYRPLLIQLRRRLVAANMVISASDEELGAAWDAYESGRRGSPGVVDLVSFQVMRRLGIKEAFTNDQHFKAAGFTALF